MTTKYQITATQSQLELIQKALDMYSRIGMGQVGTAVTDHPDVIKRIFSHRPGHVSLFDVSSAVDAIMKHWVFEELSQNGYLGIHSYKIDNSNRDAYDMIQVIRSKIARDSHKDGDSTTYVRYDSPMKTGNEDFIQIEKVED